MANPSAAHEPSMEEILASIRQIISEDGEGSQAPEGKSAGEDDASSAAEAAPVETESVEDAVEPQADRSETDESDAEVRFEPDPAPESAFFHGESMTPRTSASAAEAEPYAPYTASPRSQESDAPAPAGSFAGGDGRHLMSPQSDQAVHGAFSALAHTILAQNARTLEDLVAEMLQPMLKSWLDDNLPALVERLVQEEIQRVSRGRP